MFRIGFIIVILLFLAGFASIAQVCEIDATETKYRDKELSFKTELLSTNQVDYLVLWERTEVHYLIHNTDSIEGDFTLNFLFENGEDIKTNTRKIKIAAGAKEAVTEVSSLNGESSVQLVVIPPTKQIPYEEAVKKKVTILKKILELIDMYND